jgi:ATP-dependent RNA helicase HelY
VARRLERVEPGPATDGRHDSKEVRALRRSIERHPCHSCPDIGRHLHFAERARRLERELAGIERRINRRTGTLSRRFEEVVGILNGAGYVDGWTLTPKGLVLTGIYNESDLLTVEALTSGVFDGLEGAELAAVCSTLVYEARGPEVGSSPPAMPTDASRRAWKDLVRLWEDIHAEEQSRGLELTREPDAGFAEHAYRWAAGAPLENVISEDDPPGDFVRNVKQLVDLLRQMEDVVESRSTGPAVKAAIAGLHRGVVAYSSVDI